MLKTLIKKIRNLFRPERWILVDATIEVEISEATGPMPWTLYFRAPGVIGVVPMKAVMTETHLVSRAGQLPMTDALVQKIYAIVVNHNGVGL